jgi:transcriptional regulator with AAA-type ATPase domain
LKRSQKLAYPLNNIDDSNFWHYTLQLSTYAWMIQKIDPRFNIKLLQLIHYDHDGNVTEYNCEYLKNDVERMLAFYKKELEHEEFKKTRQKIVF